ncbi:MAG TPA: universal stress protein [Streptosporangiaceae bacterium]|nr:universal stress protein [Streptosporangiaceae bacterium]
MAGGNSGQLVVVGVDGSAESVAALRWAGQYGAASGATVRAVRAWHYPAAAGPAPIGRAPHAVTEEVEEERMAELREAIAAAYPDGPPDSVQAKVVYGRSAEALLEQAGEADLLVVGHKGRGAFTGMLLGSVTMHCVTHAPCPVTVVRAGKA